MNIKKIKKYFKRKDNDVIIKEPLKKFIYDIPYKFCFNKSAFLPFCQKSVRS